MKVLRLIIATGLIFSSIVLADAFYPKKKTRAIIDRVNGVMEHTGNGRSSRRELTHYAAYLSNGAIFKISKNDTDLFTPGDSVTLSTSQLFKRHSYLYNDRTDSGITPILGIFSYFLIAPIIMHVVSLLGVKYRHQYRPLTNCAMIVIFTILATIVFLIRS